MINNRITFIGPGSMAEAIFSGLLRDGLSMPERVTVSGPNEARVQKLSQKYSVIGTSNNVAAVKNADIVVLSIKPQRLPEVLTELGGNIPSSALVLSIIAGASMNRIKNGLHHNVVVRTMPNTPSQIGEGITVWTASEQVSPTQREVTRSILGALGKEIFVQDEHYLDMATALSGTGPAYVYMFMESMIDAGVHMGLPRRISEELVLQTILGSVEYYKQNDQHVSALRNQVTSPGGTSAEALYYLEKAGFRTALSRAIWAAYQRSTELGKDPAIHIPENNSKNQPFED